MTLLEYQTKLHMLMVSDAPVEDKEKAIAELRTKFNTDSSVEIARQQIEESKADTSDIGTTNE